MRSAVGYSADGGRPLRHPSLALRARARVALAPAAKRSLHASFTLSYVLTFLVFHGSFGSLAYTPDAAGASVAFRSLGIPAAATAVLFPAALIGYVAALGAAGALLWRGAASPRDLVPRARVALTHAPGRSRPRPSRPRAS